MKIFCIGLSKTGTTSLAHALTILGYKTKDNPGIINYDAGDLSSIDTSALEENDAISDTPIPSFYRELDTKYPDSKFILTVRDMDGWLVSCKKQFTQKLADKQNDAHNRLFMDLYDSTVFDEEKFRKGYQDFVDGVYRYFADRQQDLLTLNISSGDGWETLCPFLGKPVPDVPFPKANVTKIRWMNINDVTGIAKQAGREAMDVYTFIQDDRSSFGNSTASALRKLGYYLQKARYHFHKDSTRSLEIAMDASLRTICAGLKESNENIPVIASKLINNVPCSERQKWNHFWLVDPLDGSDLSDDPETTLTLSISLIEDRTPILGVVYAPVIDTVYYAMKGKDAFRICGNADPVKLVSQAGNEQGQPGDLDIPSLLNKTRPKTGPGRSYNALSVCLLAEGNRATWVSPENTMEWQTAAAQAVVSAAGMQFTSCETGKQLTYNKKGFANNSFVIEAATIEPGTP